MPITKFVRSIYIISPFTKPKEGGTCKNVAAERKEGEEEFNKLGLPFYPCWKNKWSCKILLCHLCETKKIETWNLWKKTTRDELKLLYYTKGEGQFLFRNETTKEKKTRKYHHMHRVFAIVESLYIYSKKKKKEDS